MSSTTHQIQPSANLHPPLSPSSPLPPSPQHQQPPVDAQAGVQPASGPVRRKASRRANTAERRATHNAVERQRRETLNGRFLDLAALLPNLASVRRPSKSAIVNSSIALIHTQRRLRSIAGRELRVLKTEADMLRRELNEWRARASLPTVDEPPRSAEFGSLLMVEEELEMGEDERRAYEMRDRMEDLGDDEDNLGDDDYAPHHHAQMADPRIAAMQQAQAHHMQQQQQLALMQQQQQQHHQHQQQQAHAHAHAQAQAQRAISVHTQLTNPFEIYESPAASYAPAAAPAASLSTPMSAADADKVAAWNAAQLYGTQQWAHQQQQMFTPPSTASSQTSNPTTAAAGFPAAAARDDDAASNHSAQSLHDQLAALDTIALARRLSASPPSIHTPPLATTMSAGSPAGSVASFDAAHTPLDFSPLPLDQARRASASFHLAPASGAAMAQMWANAGFGVNVQKQIAVGAGGYGTMVMM